MYNKKEWDDLKEGGKSNYIKITIYRMVPLGIILVLVLKLFEKGTEVFSGSGLIYRLLITAAIFAVIGIVAGMLEWELFENLMEKLSGKKRKRIMALIVGIVSWGIPIATASLIAGTIYGSIFLHYIIWISVGYLFGLVLMRKHEWK